MASLADDGRALAIAVGAARMGLGISVLLAPGAAMRAMLFGETNAAGHGVARLVGARDLGLGLAILAAREDRQSLRRLTVTGGLLDVADAVALGISVRNPGTRLAGIGGVLFAGSGAVLSARAAQLLARG